MPRPFHKALGVTHAQLLALGIFDGFTDVDSKFYVDPHLLKQTKVPEFKGAYEVFRKHFSDVFRLVALSKEPSDSFAKKAVRMLTIKEISSNGIGYGKSTSGSAVGKGLATQLFRTAQQLTEAGIKDPAVFELLGLFEEDFGADRISDMAIWIALEHIAAYNVRIARKLKLATTTEQFGGKKVTLPADKESGEGIMLLPNSVLNDLPVAEGFGGLAAVAEANAALRDSLNKSLGEDWARVINAYRKGDFKEFLLKDPAVFKQLLDSYKAAPGQPYDFVRDPLQELGWYITAQAYRANHPLDLSAYKTPSRDNLISVVRSIVAHFKDLVENHGLWENLYAPGKNALPERSMQRLFYGIAHAYCKANDIDISPEVNSGGGPVDFKFSKGFNTRVVVEMKRSLNTKLVPGFNKQVKRYQKAEEGAFGVYLIVRVHAKKDAIDAVLALRKSRVDAKAANVPDVVVVDGLPQKSASKLK